MRRPRAPYITLLIATVAPGLASRWYPAAFPVVVARYGGDALRAGMVLWPVALLRPATRTTRIALTALAIALLELYHASRIDTIRATQPGSLILGQGFLWSDLVSYTVGVTLMAVLDGWLTRRLARSERPVTCRSLPGGS